MNWAVFTTGNENNIIMRYKCQSQRQKKKHERKVNFIDSVHVVATTENILLVFCRLGNSRISSFRKQVFNTLKWEGSEICKLCLISAQSYARGRGGYSHTLPIRVCAAQRGSDFEAADFRTGYPFQRRFLERGIKNCGSRLYLLFKIVADYEEAFIWCLSRTNKEISF